MMSTAFAFLIVFLSLLNRTKAQTCQGASQYDKCSLNTACGCLFSTFGDNDGICGYLYLTCSEFVACTANNRTCYYRDHVCITHPRCNNHPICYPMKMATEAICPLMLPSTTTRPLPPMPDDGICASATWSRDGITVAGGNGQGSALNQLNDPKGLFVDDDDTIYIADANNNRVIKVTRGVSSGLVVAGGNGPGNRSDQLDRVSSLVVTKNGTMFICDQNNKRVQRWLKNDSQGQTLVTNVSCYGMAIDSEGSLYDSSYDDGRVTKWPSDQLVAGGNGQGSALNQLSNAVRLFVDREHSVFVADSHNSRVMKWSVDAKQGIVVAGGNGIGIGNNQLNEPFAIVVDQMGTVYVVEWGNQRVMRWFKDSRSGTVIIGGRGSGNQTYQLARPKDLAFDRHGNLYVADTENYRIQMFTIDKSSCLSVAV